MLWGEIRELENVNLPVRIPSEPRIMVLENTTVVALDVDNANSLQNLIQVFNAQKIQVFSLLVNWLIKT